MAQNKLEAQKITKPIQLLPALLFIASIINAPLFITSIFRFQTKYRPEIQEDTFYSKYIKEQLRSQNEQSVEQSQIEMEDLKTKVIETKELFQKTVQDLNLKASQSSQLIEVQKDLDSIIRAEAQSKITHQVKTFSILPFLKRPIIKALTMAKVTRR